MLPSIHAFAYASCNPTVIRSNGSTRCNVAFQGLRNKKTVSSLFLERDRCRSKSAIRSHQTIYVNDSEDRNEVLSSATRSTTMCRSEMKTKCRLSRRRTRMQMRSPEFRDDDELSSKPPRKPTEASPFDSFVDKLFLIDSRNSEKLSALVPLSVALGITPALIFSTGISQILFLGIFGLLSILSLNVSRLFWDQEFEDIISTKSNDTNHPEDAESIVYALPFSYISALILASILTPPDFEASSVSALVSIPPLPRGIFLVFILGFVLSLMLASKSHTSFSDLLRNTHNGETDAEKEKESLPSFTEKILMDIWDEKLRSEDERNGGGEEK